MSRKQIAAVIAVGVIAFTAMTVRDIWLMLADSSDSRWN